MRQLLSQQAYRSVMCNVVSILNPKLRSEYMHILHIHAHPYVYNNCGGVLSINYHDCVISLLGLVR